MVIIFRCLIIYVLVIAAVRLMGKRQIGDLQPSDLVITILISEIASSPVLDSSIPVLDSLLAVFMLISIEIIISFISMKFGGARKLIDGNEVMVIKNGKIDLKQLKKLRFTVDDLMGALRLKDVFCIDDVDYAYVETNGSLSVLLKAGKSTVCTEQLGLNVKDDGIPALIISDGRMLEKNFDLCDMSMDKLKQILRKNGLDTNRILIMTATKGGDFTVIDKKSGEPLRLKATRRQQ